MKVGTDGVLLGAWSNVSATGGQAVKPKRILDVGTGTGLIALMAAQRNPDAHITAIDIDPDAVRQAKENVCASPFAERITVLQADFRQDLEGMFDAILCNPPYFENALRCPDASRSTARHDDTLTFDELAQRAASLLRPQGTLSVIIPFERRTDMTAACATYGLTLIRETHVRTLLSKPPKRILLEFASKPNDAGESDGADACQKLCLESAPGVPTPAFKALLKDFYLKF